MKKYLFLPGGGGAGGIIRGWGLRGQGAKKNFARGRGCRRHYQGVGVEGAGCKNIFFARGRGCRRHYQGVGCIR